VAYVICTVICVAARALAKYQTKPVKIDILKLQNIVFFCFSVESDLSQNALNIRTKIGDTVHLLFNTKHNLEYKSSYGMFE